jgi:hypothetical protein
MVVKMEEKGLVGLSRCFRGALSGYGKPAKLLFVGSPATCLPFAEFLCNSIKDLPIEPHFMAGADTGRIRKISLSEGFGYQLGDAISEARFNIVVLLGGLAMAKTYVIPKMLRQELLKVSDLNFVLAFFFQGIMRKQEWVEEFEFSYIIDADLSRVVLEGMK